MRNRSKVSRGAPRVNLSGARSTIAIRKTLMGRAGRSPANVARRTKRAARPEPGGSSRHGDDASAFRDHPHVAGRYPCGGQGRTHLPVRRELPRETCLPPGAAVRRGRQADNRRGGCGGDLAPRSPGPGTRIPASPVSGRESIRRPSPAGSPGPSPPPEARRYRREGGRYSVASPIPSAREPAPGFERTRTNISPRKKSAECPTIASEGGIRRTSWSGYRYCVRDP